MVFHYHLQRGPLFANGQLVDTLLNARREQCCAGAFDLYAYCFVPERVRLEVLGLSESSDLISFLRSFKGRSTTLAPYLGIGNLWQKGFYDHIVREGEKERPVAWDIFNNPIRKGLVRDPREWSYSGSWMFDWKTAVAPPEELHPLWKKAMAG